jgi:methionine-rich copper-binding protein CopC
MQAFRNVVKIGLAGLFLALSSPNASAHTELVSSNPAANSIVMAVPKNISLVFSEAPILTGSYIQVEQAEANLVANPKPVLAGTSLIIPWPAAIAPGQVKVNCPRLSDRCIPNCK